MTRDELQTKLVREFSQEASSLASDDFSDAIDSAERETWTLPVTTSFKITWVTARAERHLFQLLTIRNASGFHAKNFRLQNKWEHWRQMVKDADEAFEKALEENVAEFADVSACQMFGTKVDAGFQYDRVGRDTTYSTDNKTIIQPKDTD